jgi:hypothetical protein|nr:MAG TPA: hypothetical protein [Caudoviricetes sp.]
MALGQGLFNRNGNSNQKKTINVYSNYRMTNSKDVSNYGGSSIGFVFWQGTLKIGIAPLKMVSGQDYPMPDRDREVSAYLKHTKARILAKEIRRFLNGELTSVGITTGANTFITVSDGSDFNLEQPVICIRKLNKDLSALEEEILFICRNDLHFSVHNFDKATFDGDKDFDTYKNMDLEDFVLVLEEYARSMTNATAYSVHETAQYVNSNMNASIEAIAEKLGVNSNAGTSSSFGSGSSNSNSEFKRASLDDM